MRTRFGESQGGRGAWSRSQSVALEELPQVDRSVLIGLCASCALVLVGIVFSGQILTFLSPTGLVLVLGGTVASTLVQFSLPDIQDAMVAARASLFVRSESPAERSAFLVQLARRAKEEGLLSLEQDARYLSDPFLRLGLELTVDGQDTEDARRILENEMRASNERAWRAAQVWDTMGNFAPAMGLIGTLIGLIQMLGALQDASTVGPAMSLALVATLYGSVAANLFFFPLAGKLRSIAHERSATKELTLEGLLSIARGESPLLLEQRLQSFVSLAGNQ